jgi:hypothetical protein
MGKAAETETLFRKLKLQEGISLSDFKKCLIHISVYEAKSDPNPGNSRYVFVGAYAFKGFLSELLDNYVSGNGKQL